MDDIVTADWRTPGGALARLAYRPGTSDWNTISSVMAPHDEYGLPRGLSGRACDAGAHVGAVTVALGLDNPGLAIVAIEPVPPNVELLRRNVAANGLAERVTIIAGAIGDAEPVRVWWGYGGSETARHHAYIGNSSLAYDSGGPGEPTETIYPPTRLADLLPLDWLKIDTEGGEWAFLADAAAVARVPYLIGEWHPVRGHTGADIVARLAASHAVTLGGPAAGPGHFTAVRR